MRQGTSFCTFFSDIFSFDEVFDPIEQQWTKTGRARPSSSLNKDAEPRPCYGRAGGMAAPPWGPKSTLWEPQVKAYNGLDSLWFTR